MSIFHGNITQREALPSLRGHPYVSGLADYMQGGKAWESSKDLGR